MKKIQEIDKNLRQMIAEYFFALNEMNDPQKSVELLAEHVTIMVEMINDFKKKY